MRHSVKGVLAAAGAAAALVAGTGTLAFWTDTVKVPGSASIDSGHLSLEDTTVGGCASAPWLLDGGATFTLGSSKLVPGDVLTKTCTWKLHATGDHLTATVDETASTKSGTLSTALTVANAVTIAGTPITAVSSADDGSTITGTTTVTVANPNVSDNSTQDEIATIGDYGLTLTQFHS